MPVPLHTCYVRRYQLIASLIKLFGRMCLDCWTSVASQLSSIPQPTWRPVFPLFMSTGTSKLSASRIGWILALVHTRMEVAATLSPWQATVTLASTFASPALPRSGSAWIVTYANYNYFYALLLSSRSCPIPYS